MKLFYSPTSPFVRKVLASAHRLGLADGIENLPSTVSPLTRSETLTPLNPAGKVPTMVLSDGTTLVDSRSICEYLQSLVPGGALIPDAGPERWTVLRLHDVANSLMESALLARYEASIRPEELRWQAWTDGMMGKTSAAVEALEASAAELQGRNDLGAITVGCALGYLDLRYAFWDWRAEAPALAAWWADYAQTAPMQTTAPPA